MNASVRAIEVDWGLPARGTQEILDDPRAMRLVSRLAAALARPLTVLASTDELRSELSDGAIRKLAAHPTFGPPLQRHFARQLGFDSLPLTKEFFGRLMTAPISRVCALLVVEPLEKINQFAIDLAAVTLQKRILSVVLKADRAKLREALGEERLRLATQEAALLYPRLADACGGVEFDEAMKSQDASALAQAMLSIGSSLLIRLIESQEPDLAPVFVKRQPKRTPITLKFTDFQIDQILKLIHRRASGWSDIIS